MKPSPDTPRETASAALLGARWFAASICIDSRPKRKTPRLTPRRSLLIGFAWARTADRDKVESVAALGRRTTFCRPIIFDLANVLAGGDVGKLAAILSLDSALLTNEFAMNFAGGANIVRTQLRPHATAEVSSTSIPPMQATPARMVVCFACARRRALQENHRGCPTLRPLQPHRQRRGRRRTAKRSGWRVSVWLLSQIKQVVFRDVDLRKIQRYPKGCSDSNWGDENA